MYRATRIVLGLTLCMLAFSGCSSKDSRIAVSGTVTRDGKPLDGASIAFVGNGGGSIGTGITDAEGNFTLRAAPGKNKVTVSKIDTTRAEEWASMPEEDQLMGTEQEVQQLQARSSPHLVAERFGNPDTSGIQVDVQEGMDLIDIAVTEK